MDRLYSVNQLAEELGITPRTLRFYEEAGLLTPERAGNNRVYSKRDRARMRLILRGKRLGFSLGEIRDYLDLYDADPQQDHQLRLLLDKVGVRIAALESQRTDIDVTLTELREIAALAIAELEKHADQPGGNEP